MLVARQLDADRLVGSHQAQADLPWEPEDMPLRFEESSAAHRGALQLDRGGAVEHPHSVECCRLEAGAQGWGWSASDCSSFPDADLTVVARSAAFFADDVPGAAG